jgi:hypothetical protein
VDELSFHNWGDHNSWLAMFDPETLDALTDGPVATKVVPPAAPPPPEPQAE